MGGCEEGCIPYVDKMVVRRTYEKSRIGWVERYRGYTELMGFGTEYWLRISDKKLCTTSMARFDLALDFLWFMPFLGHKPQKSDFSA